MNKWVTGFIENLKPKFWSTPSKGGTYHDTLNYRRIWLIMVLLLVMVSIIPLSILAAVTYQKAHQAIQVENHLRTSRLTSNTRRTVTYYLNERTDALEFITREKAFEHLNDPDELDIILTNLKIGFGGFVDIGLIDHYGVQIQYSGPFDLLGKNYKNQKWFESAVKQEVYVSEVVLGFRKSPHIIIAVKRLVKYGRFYVVRASLDIKQLIRMLDTLDLSPHSDVFLCNRQGYLQTDSKYYGELMEKVQLPIPSYSERTQTLETVDRQGRPILIGYAYIQDSPFILMLVKQTHEVMKTWYTWRQTMILVYIGGIVFVGIVILSLPGYMVNRIYEADQTRLRAMSEMENESRLASIGRLAAGVAHEINNPLAIISENAGYLKDLLMIEKAYSADERILDLVDDVLDSVDRCGQITKRLLGFARHFEPLIQPLNVGHVVQQVLTFLRKEATYRNIDIVLSIPENLPKIYSDQGKLQQIFLNLINNAFQAMDDGGHLEISAFMIKGQRVAVSIKDNGCGISEENMKQIFEPFFSTKTKTGGTGLGLSITYGLIKKLEGDISVKSKLGEGTTFTVTLPLTTGGED